MVSCVMQQLQFCLTGGQLHPGADLVHAAGVAEEEEAEADNAPHHQQHGDPHEEHGRFKRPGGNGAEVQRAPFAGELRGERVPDAVVEEAEVPGLRGADAVSDPVWLDEHHHGDDGEGDGEDRPQDPHGPRVTHVVGVVDFGSLLRRNHDSPQLFNKIEGNLLEVTDVPHSIIRSVICLHALNGHPLSEQQPLSSARLM